MSDADGSSTIGPAPGQGLFVLGCVRSGTTILQNALNDSRDVFLFGEPDFHEDPGTPDFAQRYNAAHASWMNQANKSTFCPKLFLEDAPWRKYLTEFSKKYQLVGSKIAIDTGALIREPDHLFDFHCRNFYSAHYVFTFRHPFEVVNSIQKISTYKNSEPPPFEDIMASYVSVVDLFVKMLRNLPNVHIVFHDAMTRRTFSELENKLNVSLSNSHKYYDNRKISRCDAAEFIIRYGDRARLVADLYDFLRSESKKGFDTIQIEQNNGNISPSHLTPLGHLARRCEMIGAGLQRGTISGGSSGPSGPPPPQRSPTPRRGLHALGPWGVNRRA